MIYVFFQYWIFVALAFVLGLFVGWATCTGGEDRDRGNWLPWAVAAFLVGLFLAGFKWIPGLPGHVLEVALMLFAAYVVGCITGCGGRSVTGGDGAHNAHDDGHGHGGAPTANADGGGHGGGHGGPHASAHASTHGDSAHASSSASANVAAQAAAADARAPATNRQAENAEERAVEAPPASAPPPSAATAPAVAASPPVDADIAERSDAAGAASAASAVSSDAPSAGAIASTSAAASAATGDAASAASQSAAHAGSAAVQTSEAPEASTAAPTTAPRGMTDGQRSILAAKEKLALQRQNAALAAPAEETTAGATLSPAASPAPIAALNAPTIRPGMTDGQRSIIAARQKMAEKATRTAAALAEDSSATSAAPEGDEGARPASDASLGAAADNLKLIKGVGLKNEAALNGLGVRRFAQIADWSADNETWVGHFIKFPGRIEREQWVAQARLLAAGIDTPHASAVKSGAIAIDEAADAPLSDDELKTFVASLPEQAAKIEDEHAYSGARPLGLAAPRNGAPDDLKKIKGIGRQNEERLHGLGIWHFDQIAAWTAENVKWIGSYLAFPGRIDRERWIDQASALSRGELTEFARRVEAGDVPTSSSAPAEGRDSKLI